VSPSRGKNKHKKDKPRSRWLKQLGATDQLVQWLKPPDRPLSMLVVNPLRPNCVEPRVRKRRPKQYPLMTKPRRQLKKRLEGN
jgi:hypothetical protein